MPRKFREQLEGWLKLVSAMWPHCPGLIDEEGRALWVDKAAPCVCEIRAMQKSRGCVARKRGQPGLTPFAISENESCLKSAVSLADKIARSGVDHSEAGNDGTGRIRDLSTSCVIGNRVNRVSSIEHVVEHPANAERNTFSDGEGPSKTNLLVRTALVAIVVIVSRSGAPLPGGRIGPRSRVQYEFFVRVEAVTIEVLEEQRLTGHSICKGATEEL